MSENIEASMPAVAFEQPATKATAPKAGAPTIWEQLGGIFTEPVTLFQRLATHPRWGHALWAMFVIGWVMMTCWGLKVDVDAMQRPVLEQNASLTASQIDQAIAVSSRFILPMSFVSVMIRNLLAVLGLGLVLWLFALTTDRKDKPSFLHALSSATVPNLVLIPYTLMIAVVCMTRYVGGKIPERLAPSGLAYYLRPENPKVYGLLAQFDLFIIAYFVMLYLATRYTMRLKTSEATICTAIVVALSVGWKVYFWV